MIQLIQGQDKHIVVTLTEKTTLTNPFYLFVFTHETTKEVFKFVKASTDDLSSYPKRFNEFLFEATHFTSAPVGKYLYQVYEQTTLENTDIALITSQVENGKMDLNKATSFAFKHYDAATNYKQYGG